MLAGEDSRTTRRAFVGLAAGTAGAVAMRPGSVTAQPRECTPTPPGIATGAIAVTPDGRTIWTTDTHATTITAHRRSDLLRGRSIDVGGAPVGIAIAPDGRLALVTTAAYDRPGLAIVDLLTGEVDRLDVGAAPRAVVFAPNGRSAYVAGGGREGTLTRVELRSGHVHAPIAVGADPHGLAVLPDGKHALVALNGAGAVALVTLTGKHQVGGSENGRVRNPGVRRIATAPFPHELALSRDGTRALVTHNGFADRRLSRIDVERRRVTRRLTVGSDPSGVAFSRAGHAVVACTGTGSVTVFAARRRTVKVGGAPRALAIAGTTALVADTRSGALHRVRLGATA